MKSYWIKNTGDRTVLELREVAQPQPDANHMLVRVRAASINRGDIMARIKRHSAAGGRPAGVDGAGEVVDAGGSSFKVGERVMFRSHGAIAEYAAVDPALASRVPDSMSWEEAGSVLAAYITGWEAVCQFGRMQAGDWILLAGVSSGVGVAALQMAKQKGVKVIGTSGSPQKLDALKKMGLDVGIVTRGGDFADAVLQATGGKGVSVAVNLVGGTAFPACVRAAADFGRVIIVGYVDNTMTADFDLETVHGRRLQIIGISNTPLSPAQRAIAHSGFIADFYPALESGAMRPLIDRVFSFDDAPAAKAYVETNQLIGKVVVRMQ
ncbi:MAG: zinc-binding dehydrogenase [Betaproteobacteria bacterium]|nr:zinc-binding dehydrogenase [Betaproteobacteria bacterium]